jgi:polyisoprenoid-binding protein YceI
MRLSSLAAFAAPLALLLAAPAGAQPTEIPGKAEVSRVVAGEYVVDPEHTLVAFNVNHLGFSPYYGLFGSATGKLTLDPKKLASAKVSIVIPMSGITVASEGLAKHMRSADFFDAAKYPTARFVSTKVTPTGAATADIHGELTVRDKTIPVVLKTRFIGAGTNMQPKVPAVGFEATTTVKRSQLGVNYGIPIVSDDVELKIAAAFNKAG